ncbi:Importin subunit beta-1-like [Oopsacas minuta]|uniref:Importin subunit beta-1-like n=1 Tax=Oopsacas minuta TaxID=111878 RepID=A0AAV7JAN6_9METZ|nr:Importin subunit beta-1-like [Oopsacas minuta]
MTLVADILNRLELVRLQDKSEQVRIAETIRLHSNDSLEKTISLLNKEFSQLNKRKRSSPDSSLESESSKDSEISLSESQADKIYRHMYKLSLLISESVPSQEQLLPIYTFIRSCLSSSHIEESISLCSLYCLWNLVPHSGRYFSQKGERESLFKLLLNSIKSENTNARQIAFEILCLTAELYAGLLQDQLEVIFDNISKAAVVESSEIADVAVRFWISFVSAVIRSQEQGGIEHTQEYDILKPFLSRIISLLLALLTKQSPELIADPNTETTEVTRTAAEALCLFCKTYKNDCVRIVLPYVEKHIENANFRFREAALVSFGSCLENNEEFLLPYLKLALPSFVNYLKTDEIVLVKDAVCWVLAGVYEFMPKIVIDFSNEAAESKRSNAYNHIDHVVPVLVETLKTTESLAKNVIDAFTNLLKVHDAEMQRTGVSLISTDPDDLPPVTKSLITYIPQIYNALKNSLDNPKMRNFADVISETICILVEMCPATLVDTVKKIHVESLQKIKTLVVPEDLKKLFDMTVEEAQECDEFYSAYLAISGSCIQKLALILSLNSAICSNVVVMLLQILFHLNQAQVSFDILPSLYEELLFNLSQIASVEYLIDTNPLIAKAESLLPLIIMILEEAFRNEGQWPEYMPFSMIEVSLNLTVQLYRLAHASDTIDKYSHQVWNALSDCLIYPHYGWEVRPMICKIVGELSQIMNQKFEPFLPQAMNILLDSFTHYKEHGVQFRGAMVEDYDDQYLENLFDGFTGVFISLSGSQTQAEKLIPYVKLIVTAILDALNNEDYVGLPSRDVLVASMVLITQMASIGVLVRDYMNSSDLFELIEDCHSSDDADLVAIAETAYEKMNEMLNDDV